MKPIRSLTDRIFLPDNINKIALLGAFSMFLSTIEYLFPRPVPFMRLGLANLPLLLGLEMLSGPSFLLLVVLKVLGQALVNGTLASYVFLFSLSGSLASAIIMQLCYRGLGKHISYIGISLMGALASNIVQISLSVQFIFGDAAWRILPLFLGIGLVSGLFIGMFAQYFSGASRWWRAFAGGTGPDPLKDSPEDMPKALGKARKVKKRKPRKKRSDLLGTFLSPSFRFWTGLAMIPAWMFLDFPAAKALILFVFGLLAYLSGKKIRFFYYIILISSITVFHILTPLGRVILVIGPVKITAGALQTGLMKGVTLCGLILLSMFTVSGKLRLPGKFGGMLARTFYFFEEILEGRSRIRASKLTASLDEMLIDLFPPERLDDFVIGETGEKQPTGKPVPSILYLLMLSVIVWGSLAVQFIL